MLEINFKNHPCKKCGSTQHYEELKKYRYGIYCKVCRSFIKWADKDEQAIIKARLKWEDNAKYSTTYMQTVRER